LKTTKYFWRMGPYGTSHLFKCTQYGTSRQSVCGKLDKLATHESVMHEPDTECKSCRHLHAKGKGWS
jgi:hypothetical protein